MDRYVILHRGKHHRHHPNHQKKAKLKLNRLHPRIGAAGAKLYTYTQENTS